MTNLGNRADFWTNRRCFISCPYGIWATCPEYFQIYLVIMGLDWYLNHLVFSCLIIHCSFFIMYASYDCFNAVMSLLEALRYYRGHFYFGTFCVMGGTCIVWPANPGDQSGHKKQSPSQNTTSDSGLVGGHYYFVTNSRPFKGRFY